MYDPTATTVKADQTLHSLHPRSHPQTHPRHLADLAAFLGLECTPEEAEDVFQRHTYATPPGDFNSYGISNQTLEWMNFTMSRTLPEAMLARYELTPIWV